LNISGLEYCYFVVYIDEKTDIFIEKIKKDSNFWKTKMCPKLVAFYKKNVLPEIIMIRIPKGLKCLQS
jgi:hypothetical protein